MPVKLNSTGGGSVTLTTPSTASDFTVTIPAATGTMVTTTSASTIEFAAGSAAAPSITTTGDTNTGIYFPAADTLAATTGGTERLRIDASGNVGIGTSSPDTLLTVNGSSKFGGTMTTGLGVSTGDVHIEIGGARTGNGNTYIDLHSAASTDFEARLIRSSGTNGQFDIINSGTGAFALSTNTAERLRIDSSGNVGIGTSSPGSLLTVNGNLAFNSGYGSAAVAYGCRAWVNFNGTGTVAIRASGNVSSITDNGTGRYTVNLTTAMPDVNYAGLISCGDASGIGRYIGGIVSSTSAFLVNTDSSGGTALDQPNIYVAIIR